MLMRKLIVATLIFGSFAVAMVVEAVPHTADVEVYGGAGVFAMFAIGVWAMEKWL